MQGGRNKTAVPQCMAKNTQFAKTESSSMHLAIIAYSKFRNCGRGSKDEEGVFKLLKGTSLEPSKVMKKQMFDCAILQKKLPTLIHFTPAELNLLLMFPLVDGVVFPS